MVIIENNLNIYKNTLSLPVSVFISNLDLCFLECDRRVDEVILYLQLQSLHFVIFFSSVKYWLNQLLLRWKVLLCLFRICLYKIVLSMG